MTTRGRRIALAIGIGIAFALPKRVECGYPGGTCQHAGSRHGQLCTPYEIEPWGLYLIESAMGRDVGFAYTSGEDCR
jgi:hypothetical protein